MRIVHVVRQFYPAVGGLEAVVLNLGRKQSETGDAVRIVTLNRVYGGTTQLAPSEWLGPIEIVRISFVGSQRYPIAPHVMKHIKDADIVHVHALDFFCDFLAATRVFHRKQMVLSTHGGFFHTDFAETFKHLYFHTISRLSMTRYGYIAASSESDRATFSRIRKRGIGTIANGVDFARFSDISRIARNKRIIYFGRIAPHKNIEKILSVLKILKSADERWSLIIAGRSMSDALTAQLVSKAKELAISNSVHFVECPPDSHLQDLIATCSIYCSASSHEGFGIAAVEACAAGLYPVLSDIPAHRETIAAVKVGSLVDFDDHASSAALINELWANKAWTAIQTDAVTKQFSWDSTSARLRTIYDEVRGTTSRLVGNIRVQVVNVERAIAAIEVARSQQRSLKVAFLNAHLANWAARDPQVEYALRDFVILNDGIGLDIASKLLFGRAFPANMNGTDFVPLLLDRMRPGLRLYLLGGTQKVIEAAVGCYRHRWPSHHVVGFRNGFFSDAESANVARDVKATAPDVILVAMGCPRQELWLARNHSYIGGIGIGVGALFDFQTGHIRRAPAWIRKARCEWIYRLFLEPRRMARRYLVGNIVFSWRTLMQWASGERA